MGLGLDMCAMSDAKLAAHMRCLLYDRSGLPKDPPFCRIPRSFGRCWVDVANVDETNLRS